MNATAMAMPRKQTSHTSLLTVVCLAQFMVILDVSIVNVALPAIHQALGFSTTGLQWVVNAYTLTFAGFSCWVAAAPTSWAATACSSPAPRCFRSPRWRARWPAPAAC
jgi:MFS family permease